MGGVRVFQNKNPKKKITFSISTIIANLPSVDPFWLIITSYHINNKIIVSSGVYFLCNIILRL